VEAPVALPLLEPAQSDFVGQGSTRPHRVGKTECTPEGGALTSATDVAIDKESDKLSRMPV
jgi:hypothetical protein